MTRPLQDKRILVVEDSYLAAMHIQDLIEDLGGTVIGPVASLDAAMDIYQREGADGAVLDINLNGTTSYPLAQRLKDAGTAIIFLTGYEGEHIAPEFADAARLTKPLDEAAVGRLLVALFAADG